MPVGLYTGPNTHTGNGVTTVFAYDFKILQSADLKVTVDGVVTTTGFTVSGAGSSGGGSITFSSAPANGVEIVLSRSRAYNRTTDYQRNGSFDEETVDADFDAVVMLVQQLDAAQKRAIKAPESVSADQVISAADWAARASKFFGFNSGGALALFAIADVAPSAVSAFISTLLDDTTAADARTTLGAVGLTGNETVAGVKTFSSLPVLPAGTPTGNQAVSATQAAALANGTYRTVQIFTGSGTYTAPAGLVRVKVRVVGGGGGSGGCGATAAGNMAAAGGGGGGGYAEKTISAATVGASQTVTVGAGGAAATAGANNGGAGGTSSFGALVSASGGSGGIGDTNSAPGGPVAGGTGGAVGNGSGGDINIPGSAGGNGMKWGTGSNRASTGPGGGSVLGATIPATDTQGGTSPGVPGQNYGGGASGAASAPSQAASAGSAGAPGIVIVEEYY
jgi:hypothetical protein